jgi:hypothetical protein
LWFWTGEKRAKTRHTIEDILHREDILCKTYRREESSGQEREALDYKTYYFLLFLLQYYTASLQVPSYNTTRPEGSILNNIKRPAFLFGLNSPPIVFLLAVNSNFAGKSLSGPPRKSPASDRTRQPGEAENDEVILCSNFHEIL